MVLNEAATLKLSDLDADPTGIFRRFAFDTHDVELAELREGLQHIASAAEVFSRAALKLSTQPAIGSLPVMDHDRASRYVHAAIDMIELTICTSYGQRGADQAIFVRLGARYSDTDWLVLNRAHNLIIALASLLDHELTQSLPAAAWLPQARQDDGAEEDSDR